MPRTASPRSIGGDTNYGEHLGGVIADVEKADTTTALTSSVNPSKFGQSVTFTATVTAVAPGSGTPTGTVTFKDGATTLGTGTLNAAASRPSRTDALSVGHHAITAVYGGDSNFNGSTSTRSIKRSRRPTRRPR